MSAVIEAPPPEPIDRVELDLSAPLPRRRQDLIVRPAGQEGWFVVKAPAANSYFQIGLAEHFLLGQLDGEHTAIVVRKAFEEHFREPLTATDLDDFLKMAASMELLEVADGAAPLAPPSRPKTPQN